MRPSAPADLARLQRGFLAFVTGRGEAPAALARIEAADACDAREQLAVYRRMYALRMAREVAREFPATRALLGKAAFDGIARAYVASHASRSFTLEGYAAALPAFLRRTGARRDAAALAQLERALERIESGPQLVRFDFDVELAYARFLRGAPIHLLRSRTTWLALHRRGRGIARVRVAAREVALLRALLRGADLERALGLASASGLGPAGIRRAVERWVAAGVFVTTRSSRS